MNKSKADNYFIQTIIMSLITAGITFGYFIIKDKGFFTVIDDFNSQQLPFATAVWNMLHSGDIGEWSWNIDLGSSFINTFSFYDLGSPFIWLSFLAPKGVFPYLAGFLYIVKYVIAAATAYLYLRLFLDERQWGVIGALLYAFSGFQTTNLEFFHFHDVVAFFPLLLLGLELTMKDKKYRPFFVLTVFLNCLLNYYFFVEEVVFLALYYLVRYRKLPMRQYISGILSCILCGILGVGMAAILFFPSILYVLENPRSHSKLTLKSFVYGPVYLLYLLKGFLFPGEPMREISAVLQQNWNSTSAYLPFFGISMVTAYVMEKKRNWLRWLLLALGIFSFFPLTESMFLLFSEANQRWWYMFVLLMAMATTKVLENSKNYPVMKSSLLYIGILTIFYFFVQFARDLQGNSLIYDLKRFTLFYLIALIGPMIFILLKRYNKISYRLLLTFTMCGCIVTTSVTLYFYRSANGNIEEYREAFEAGLQLQKLDDQYRYNSTNNVMMINGDAAGIGVFCTTVENSSRKFDTLFGHNSTNSTKNKYDIPGLPELLGGKYKIARNPEEKKIVDTVTGQNATFYVTEGNASPIGFAVDYVLTEEEFMRIPQDQKALTLMQAAIIDENKLDELSNITSHMAVENLNYEEDINSLIERTILNKVNDFQRGSHGFTCTTSYDKSRLLYFTVPWSKGWRATVDGTETETINSGGMMALVVPAGDHQVNFSYHTPGFQTGIFVSVISLLIFIAYVVFNMKTLKKGARK